MYNEDRKKAFIKSKHPTLNTKDFMIRIFNVFEPYETLEWHGDLSEQTADTLKPALEKCMGLRKKTGRLVVSVLKEYVRWCKRNGYKTAQGVFELDIQNPDRIRNQMVSSPSHLRDAMNLRQITVGNKLVWAGLDTADKETVDITYRVFLWMAYSGIRDEDAVRISSNCVDIDTMTIRIPDDITEYTIYEEAREDFQKAVDLTEFVYEHPNYTTRRPRAPGNVIMRGLVSPTVNLRNLRPIINKRFGGGAGTEGVLSYRKVYLSGVFYRMYQRETNNHVVDFSEVVAREMQNKIYKTTETRTLASIANQYSRELLEDYDVWKEVFYSNN